MFLSWVLGSTLPGAPVMALLRLWALALPLLSPRSFQALNVPLGVAVESKDSSLILRHRTFEPKQMYVPFL